MPTRTQQSDIISCAYASHGDTKQVLLFPKDPNECFTMAADSFDLAERLQTPVMVMSDLDIGMNDWMTDEFAWDDARVHDRGKVLNEAELEAAESWGRYQDVDGDGIPYRTLPGTHPTKGAYFTRGTSHDESARYTEDGVIHARVLERIARKIDDGAEILPQPERTTASETSKVGIVYFGANTAAVNEGLDLLKDEGQAVNTLRIRAFPFSKAVRDFIDDHDLVFVMEQNRDAQMRSLLITELECSPQKLVPSLSFDGTPMTAKFVRDAVCNGLAAARQAAE